MATDGILMSRVVAELNNNLIKGRVNKIYQISKNEVLFQIRAQSSNQKLFISIHPMYARVQLTHLTYPTPPQPNAFTMLLRKHLEGAYIESIQQIQLDRIIEITFIGKNELMDTVKYYMYIEIMGKHSNMIVTYEDKKIIDCLKRVSPSHNSIRFLQPGATYQLPPLLDKKDPFHSEFVETDNLTRTYQGFSPELSREVLYRIDNGESFEDITKQLSTSNSLYIHTTKTKEYFHVIPLTHLDTPFKEYSLSEGLDTYFDLIDQKDRIKQQTSNLAKVIQNEYQKNVNKLHKLEKTLFDSKNSDDYRIKGDLLFANLHLIQKGQTEITVDNYYDNTQLTIALDEKLDGKRNAQKYYNKYQKAKNSFQHLNEQISLTQEEINYFDTLLSHMENASYYDALEIKEELENGGYIRKRNKKEVHRKKQKPHITQFKTKDNIIISVGKNNIQNDYITFKLASKNDTWFHAKDIPGSHVVVHTNEPDEYTTRLAATIAAYYSKGKMSSSVPVNYTLVRTLKKPQSAKTGQVILNRYSTIYIDPDDTFLNEVEIVQ